ncbi:hypothetical protein AB0E27_32205 [Streptomyces sparsogenes]|uniref:hypothetical protein n=1 Tax=Streptomyces sparsogenes TaxID=67365 RepID=UPI0033DF7274
MRQVVEAVTRFPTVTLTSALVVALGFWLLVLLGRADVRGFDSDAPSLAKALHGLPVAVAASVVIVSAWLVTFTGMVLMEPMGLTGLGDAWARVALLALSVCVAGVVTHALAAPLARLFAPAPGPPRRGAADGTPSIPAVAAPEADQPPARGRTGQGAHT